eukprot:gene26259-17360_t
MNLDVSAEIVSHTKGGISLRASDEQERNDWMACLHDSVLSSSQGVTQPTAPSACGNSVRVSATTPPNGGGNPVDGSSTAPPANQGQDVSGDPISGFFKAPHAIQNQDVHGDPANGFPIAQPTIQEQDVCGNPVSASSSAQPVIAPDGGGSPVDGFSTPRLQLGNRNVHGWTSPGGFHCPASNSSLCYGQLVKGSFKILPVDQKGGALVEALFAVHSFRFVLSIYAGAGGGINGSNMMPNVNSRESSLSCVTYAETAHEDGFDADATLDDEVSQEGHKWQSPVQVPPPHAPLLHLLFYSCLS